MKNNITLFRFAALLSFLLASFPLSAGNRLEWEAVQGADHYRVIIRQNDQLLLDTPSKDCWLPLFLPPGNYELQIQVINTFGKKVSESPWEPLRIFTSAPPFIAAFSPNEIHQFNLSSFSALVTGWVPSSKNITGSEFYLRNTAGRTIPLIVSPAETSHQSDTNYQNLSLAPAEDLPESGVWSLVMKNPDGKSYEKKDALRIIKNLQPHIKRIKPRFLPFEEQQAGLQMQINNQEEGASVTISGPSEIPVLFVNKSSPNVLNYYLDISSAAAGWYSVSVRNPSGGSHEKNRAFKIYTDQSGGVNGVPAYPHNVYFALTLGLPIRDKKDKKTSRPVYAGFTMGYRQEFLPFSRKSYWLSGFEWEAALESTFPFDKGIVMPEKRIYPMQQSVLLGLNYIIPSDSLYKIQFRIAAGPVLSLYDWKVSIDWQTIVSGGIRLEYKPELYMSFLLGLSSTYYVDDVRKILKPTLEGGWKW